MQHHLHLFTGSVVGAAVDLQQQLDFVVHTAFGQGFQGSAEIKLHVSLVRVKHEFTFCNLQRSKWQLVGWIFFAIQNDRPFRPCC